MISCPPVGRGLRSELLESFASLLLLAGIPVQEKKIRHSVTPSSIRRHIKKNQFNLFIESLGCTDGITHPTPPPPHPQCHLLYAMDIKDVK